MLVVNKLSKRFRGENTPLFEDVTFTVNGGERVGVIGPNGSGKSTLLKLIVGELDADRGSLMFAPPNLRIGYLAQGMVVDETQTLDEVLFPHLRELDTVEAELERLAGELGDGAESTLEAYHATLERITFLSERMSQAHGEKMLAEMGLDLPLDTPVATLSGGQKTRLNLARILLQNPQLLVLDEPTNHLDIQALNWLESWLMQFAGGVLIVSHDRAFLDRVVNRIVALDTESQSARVFVGNYTDYIETLRYEKDQQWAQWQDQQVKIAKMQRDVQTTMARSIRKENATVNDQQRRYAKKVAQKAKAKETRLKRYIEAEDRVEKPTRTWEMKLDFDRLPTTHGVPVRTENLSIGYESPLLSNLNLAIQAGERIALLGPNGQGKSTLLKTLIGELKPLAGTLQIGSGVQIGYLAQEQDILDSTSTPLKTLQDQAGLNHTDARSFLHHFLFGGDEVFRPIEAMSYGERARLMLALLVAKGANLLVLDEPLNHLDLSAREQFETALMAFPGSVLAVVHDRYFVDKFATHIWHIDKGTLQIDYQNVE